jgi:hypothetical protein
LTFFTQKSINIIQIIVIQGAKMKKQNTDKFYIAAFVAIVAIMALAYIANPNGYQTQEFTATVDEYGNVYSPNGDFQGVLDDQNNIVGDAKKLTSSLEDGICGWGHQYLCDCDTAIGTLSSGCNGVPAGGTCSVRGYYGTCIITSSNGGGSVTCVANTRKAGCAGMDSCCSGTYGCIQGNCNNCCRVSSGGSGDGKTVNYATYEDTCSCSGGVCRCARMKYS